VGVVTIVEQGGEAFIHLQIYITAVATVPAIGATAGNKFLPPERKATASAVPGFNLYFYFIDKAHNIILKCNCSVRPWIPQALTGSGGE
jgi:hypothetical protein